MNISSSLLQYSSIVQNLTCAEDSCLGQICPSKMTDHICLPSYCLHVICKGPQGIGYMRVLFRMYIANVDIET
jgi:hypothetical protein